MSLAHIIKHVGPETRVVNWDGHEYRTPRKLLEMAMACCPDCGTVFSTYPMANWCPSCKEFVLIINEDAPVKKYFTPVVFAPADTIPVHKQGQCVDCGVSIGEFSTRCRPCFGRSKSQFKKPEELPAEKFNHCIDCKCVISPFGKRCKPCGAKHRWGKWKLENVTKPLR